MGPFLRSLFFRILIAERIVIRVRLLFFFFFFLAKPQGMGSL